MIVVTVGQTGIIIKGHAGYAENGKDIVCAAISVLSQNLVNSLEMLTKDKISCDTKSGYMEITWKNLSEQGKLLVDSFFIGIGSIATTYGEEYVRIR